MYTTLLRVTAVLLLPLGAWLVLVPQAEPPKGPFGFSLVSTTSGSEASVHDFLPDRRCALCHERQVQETKGTMHSVSHRDSLYRRFAELAREEVGDEYYAYCSGCHAPAGVAGGLIPDFAEEDLPDVVTDGVTCEVCHRVAGLTGADGPWGEPGNASIVLEDRSMTKYGPGEIEALNRFHTGAERDFYTRSEYCASCHTVIHPLNGLRLEHTYDEWKRSVYAEKGIQCQDCHMRSVEDATLVARTLEPPAKEQDLWASGGKPRPISRHYFVGGNVDAHALGGGEAQGEMALARLKSAATIAVEPSEPGEDGARAFDVVVTNVGAGHSLPTSLTDLREVWVHVRVTSADGTLLLESGQLDEKGELPPGVIRYGTTLLDEKGEVTHKPWEAVVLGRKRLIPAKGSLRDRVEVASAETGALEVEVRLLYRTAPPHVIAKVMGEDAYTPRIIEMARVVARLE